MSPEPATPPPITPDDKDWTWVLDRPCPECGVDAAGLDLASVPAEVRAIAARLVELLADGRATVRPDPGRWSAVEYACHVRDVFLLYDERLHLMLERDDPLFANWDQDVTAVEDAYATQDPAVVAGELTQAADLFASSYEAVSPEELSRTGRRSDGATFTVDSFTRYFLHDPLHHVWDVKQGYAALGR